MRTKHSLRRLLRRLLNNGYSKTQLSNILARFSTRFSNINNGQSSLLLPSLLVLPELQHLDLHTICSTASEYLCVLGMFDPEQIALLYRAILGLSVTFILGKIISWLWQLVPIVLQKLLIKELRLYIELTLTKFALSIELIDNSNNSEN